MIRADGSTIDHYELLEFVAEGAQAQVHRAKDLYDGSEVVVKFPQAHVLHHPVLVARWRREAAITSGLFHPRIVCRRDSGEVHSAPYIVLEYVDCGTLRGFIGGPADPLPIAQAQAWGRQLAEALVFLHGQGVVHQDLKPDNVMVNTDLSLKVGDFGAAIAARPSGGRQGRHPLALPIPPEGTAGYLSPEQITGVPSDERSDLYSWGIVMYELLTGRLPFGPGPAGRPTDHSGTADDPLAAMEAHLRDAPTPIRTLRPDVSPALDGVVMTAMRRHPGHRYQTAAALLADLERLDSLDPGAFDLSPEDPITTPVGGAELSALLHLVLLTALGFLGIASVAVAFSAVLH